MTITNDSIIDYTAHYFVPLEVVDAVIHIGGQGMLVSSSDNIALVECTISEGLYGKIVVAPVGFENGLCTYRPEKYYECDFISHLHNGSIIKKESETQHIEPIEDWEPLTYNTHLVHRGYVVVD